MNKLSPIQRLLHYTRVARVAPPNQLVVPYSEASYMLRVAHKRASLLHRRAQAAESQAFRYDEEKVKNRYLTERLAISNYKLDRALERIRVLETCINNGT